jgi:hypothetical protein
MLVVFVVVSGLWLTHYKSYPRGTGFDDLTGVFVPFALLVLTGLWLVVRALLHGRVHWRTVTVVVVALAFALAPVIVYCGPVSCFAPGPNRLMGWFVVGGVALAALVHHLVLERLTPEAGSVTHRV